MQRAEWLRKINVCGAYYTSVPLQHIVVRWQQGVLPEMQWHNGSANAERVMVVANTSDDGV